MKINVNDITGINILSEIISVNELGLTSFELNTSNITPGMYMVSVSSGNVSLTEKLFIE